MKKTRKQLIRERNEAHKKLRAAAHRLLCHTTEYDDQPGVRVKTGFITALDRALTAADAAEQALKEESGRIVEDKMVSKVAGRALRLVERA